MSIVLTNGSYYIRTSKTGGICKTDNIEEAQTFISCNRAMKKVLKAPVKCKGYYPYDTEDIILSSPNKKQQRKKYTSEQRKIIYDRSEGRCQLCGRKISFFDMSIDHVIPISKGGADSMENLQASCIACNSFKSNILPDVFYDRITEIFLYQMEKKLSDVEMEAIKIIAGL